VPTLRLPILALLLLLPGSPGLAADGADCPFEAGALPADTLPAGAPHGDEIPIDHIVVLMQENRSFDHYFGQLRPHGRWQAEGPPRDASNPDPEGGPPIEPFHQTALCEVADLAHSWNASHAQFDGGAMDGFTATNVDAADPSGSRAMGYYEKSDLPFYFDLYRTFAIGDRYFASVLGPTYPNRFYLLAGTSFGHVRNDLSLPDAPPTILEKLEAAGVSWKVYFSQFPFSALFPNAAAFGDHFVPIVDLYADAAAGALPSVAFVDPPFFGGVNEEGDEHPPANVQVGQAFVASVIESLFASPQWPGAALFVTYDEHGGYFDHVPPPAACVPDDVAPMLRSTDTPAAFDRYGFRVPVVVVSPFARPRFVSHVVHDHTSILRFIETRFDLPALTRRDANADPMLEFFDFGRPAFAKPPRLPPALVDPERATECSAIAGQPSGEL
jgi:phospholipase C